MVPDEIATLLQKIGVPLGLIRTAVDSTCLVNELGVNGDDLDDFSEVMRMDHGVDMSEFDPRVYAPSEGELLFPTPLINWLLRKPKPLYERLPLELVARSIQRKRWVRW
mgnify:CR=1 FL=1